MKDDDFMDHLANLYASLDEIDSRLDLLLLLTVIDLVISVISVLSRW